MAHKFGLSAEPFQDASHEAFWDETRDFPLLAERLVYRVTLPRAAPAEFLKTVESWDSVDIRRAIVADLAVGILWISYPPDQTVAGDFEKLLSLAGQHRGQAIMLVSPAELKRDVNVWGPAPTAFFLMRRIKQQFDPKGLMNPGRFVGRL